MTGSGPVYAAILACAGILTLGPAGVAGQASTTLLDRYDLQRRSSRFDLPGRLEEVSGLAATPDGRLLAHDDERAVIHVIDPAEEEVGARFSLGDPPVRGDFEGIALVGERVFLVTSRGILYEFREMPDRREAPYRVTDTELGAHCEIEGLDYDPADHALLFACKVSAPDRGTIVVHRVPVVASQRGLPPLVVDREQLPGHGLSRDFAPSAVAIDPAAGTIVLLSASPPALLEVDRTGRVLAGTALSPERHRQPEGLAFGTDGTLYVADEGDGRDARVTAYERRADDR